MLLRCRAARIRSPPRPQRLWASSWGSATQHGASCGVQVVKGVGSRGSLEPGAMEQRALRTPSPLLLRRERVRWGVAMAVGSERTREWMEERGCPVSSVNCLRLRRFFVLFT